MTPIEMEQQELMDIMTCLLFRGKEDQHTFDEYSIWSIEDLHVINHIEILMMFPSQKGESIRQCLTFITKYLTMNRTAMETNQSLKSQKWQCKRILTVWNTPVKLVQSIIGTTY